jgi:uncharacterized protein (TIGR02117 family)
MKYLKKLLKILCVIVGLITIISLIIIIPHYIPINSHSSSTEAEFYLSDNGKHLDIVLYEEGSYKSYGWGSKIFFTEVETWDDLTYSIAFKALFTEPESLMRVINYQRIKPNWIKVNCSKEQYLIVKEEINRSFFKDKEQNAILSNSHIKFYKASGSYNALNTCNTWVNNVLDKAKLKCVLYSLTSGAIVELYKNKIK